LTTINQARRSRRKGRHKVTEGMATGLDKRVYKYYSLNVLKLINY
jgi:hypothetical protein